MTRPTTEELARRALETVARAHGVPVSDVHAAVRRAAEHTEALGALAPEELVAYLAHKSRNRLPVFLPVGKPQWGFPTKGLQSAARRICAPMAHKFHTCSLSGIFSAAHVAGEND